MTPNTVEHIDGLLAELSPIYTIASQGSARLVAGPTGVFVLVLSGDDVERATELATRLAPATRAALADHLAWVPFVDAVVVIGPDDRRAAHDADDHTSTGASDAVAVPVDMLSEVLVEGRAVIELSALGIIDRLIREHALAPWRVGNDAGAAKIDLCAPSPRHVASPSSSTT
jgi:hypothetical protein